MAIQIYSSMRLTRRMSLSQLSSLYGPLGLILIILKAKLLMKLLITTSEVKEKAIDWNDPIDDTIFFKNASY